MEPCSLVHASRGYHKTQRGIFSEIRHSNPIEPRWELGIKLTYLPLKIPPIIITPQSTQCGHSPLPYCGSKFAVLGMSPVAGQAVGGRGEAGQSVDHRKTVPPQSAF